MGRLGLDSRLRSSTQTGRHLALLVALWLLSRLVLLGALAWTAERTGRGLDELITAFDGGHYLAIATTGYPRELEVGPDGLLEMSRIAFFPLFPGLLAGPVAAGVPFATAAVVLNLLCGGAAVVLTYLLVAEWASPRTALGVAGLWFVTPLAYVLTLAYTEALYSALALGTLLLLVRRHWWAAGLVGALATATRPTGVVVAACALVAAVEAFRARAHDRRAALAPVFLAPLGFVGYMAFLAVWTGRPDAWFAVEREGWGSSTDLGLQNARRFVTYLSDPTRRPAATAAVLVIVVLLVLIVLSFRHRPPLPVLAFGVLTVVLALITRNTFSSTPRFALPATGLLLVPLVDVILRRIPILIPLAWGAGLVAMVAAGMYVTGYSTFPP